MEEFTMKRELFLKSFPSNLSLNLTSKKKDLDFSEFYSVERFKNTFESRIIPP